MNQYPMRYFLISGFLLFFNSCSLSTTKEFLKQNPTKDFVYNNYFSDLDKDYVYKANFEVYNNRFGGILIVKKIKENHHRVVFTTEFGNKIFDFEFIDNQFSVNYILNDLNKKIIINTLEKDLQILIKQDNKVLKQFFNATEIIYQTKMENRSNYYVISKKNNRLVRIINTSKSKEKATLYFNNVDDSIANNIEIIHHNFKMKINLKYISN